MKHHWPQDLEPVPAGYVTELVVDLGHAVISVIETTPENLLKSLGYKKAQAAARKRLRANAMEIIEALIFDGVGNLPRGQKRR